MNCINITTSPTDRDLIGRSHWWGAPDLPEDVPYPYVMVTDRNVMVDENGEPLCDAEGNELYEEEEYSEPLTFICQVRMEDVAPLDREGLLPRKGMMYFFAAIDYFLGEDSPIEMPMHGEAGAMVRAT